MMAVPKRNETSPLLPATSLFTFAGIRVVVSDALPPDTFMLADANAIRVEMAFNQCGEVASHEHVDLQAVAAVTTRKAHDGN